MDKNGWIGVDLDGTAAHYDHWRGVEHIGDPIPLMTSRILCWLNEGKDVRIFTARVDGGTVALNSGNPEGAECQDVNKVISIIQDYTEKHYRKRLPVICKKDYAMVELWDDRAVQVVPNTGERVDEKPLIQIEMNEDIEFILDRVNFICGSWAHRLRELGHVIKEKSEAEQAYLIHMLINLYYKYPESWREEFDKIMQGKK